MRFLQAKHTYGQSALIQGKMQDELIFQIQRFWGNRFERIFEFGAGNGMLTQKLCNTLEFKKLICNDLFDFREDFENLKNVEFLCFDMQDFPLRKHLGADGFDLLLSNAALQWMDPRFLFKNLAPLCAQNAKIALTSFGKQNLQEITSLTGLTLNYLDLPDLCEILKNSGFKITYAHQWQETLKFKTPMDAMRHLKQTGVNSLQSNFYIKKSMLNALHHDFSNTLTYQPLIILAELSDSAVE